MKNISLWEKLYALQKPIRVGIAGGGEFASEIVAQCAQMHNMEVCVIADLLVEKAKSAFVAAGYALEDIIYTDNFKQAIQSIEAGKRVVTQDALMISKLPVDAICDVTGDPAFGAEYACSGIDNGKHVVVVNIESDAGIGSILRRRADSAGVVYTEADGDQPSLIKALYDFCLCLGIQVEVAGKWTHQRPWSPDMPSRGRVDAGFLDGSKNQVEMCCVANMTGLIPDVRGLHLPSLALHDILPALCPQEEGGMLSHSGVVETVNCLTSDGLTEIESNLGGGVFVIANGGHNVFRQVARTKGFIHSADGNRVLLYRPYHFVGIETPMTILRAVLYGEPTASPMRTPCADVISIAKRDLMPGTRLDGIGGANVRGEIVTREQAFSANALPLVLAQDVTVNRHIHCGEIISYNDLTAHIDNLLWRLRAQQDLYR